MEKSIVEQCREYYPMTFYSDSLVKIINMVNKVKEKNNTFPRLEPMLLTLKNVHYYNEIGLNQFWCGCGTILLLVVSIFSALVIDRIIATVFLLLTAVSFLSYYILQRYKNNTKKELIYIEQKLLSRQYKIKDSIIDIKPNLSNLLLDSLVQRDNIYNFEINDSANKGLSESYFLSYLQKWFSYPWRIIEHCQFQGDRYTPTADFIIINDDLKLAIDLEIDEPYTLKDSMPIHLVEDRKYIVRDKFFLGLGYIVIRFAEYQVVKHPDYCCLHIARVLNQFLERDMKISVPHKTEIQVLKLQDWRVKTWTQRESQIMADNKVRDCYLEPVRAFNLNH